MANKQINELTSGTSVNSTDRFPIQNDEGITKSITAEQIADFIGGGSTPNLSDVLDQGNYTNGYDIILNAGSKLTSSQTEGEDSLQMIEGYINLSSYDGNFDSTQLYLTPTQNGIRKNNNQTGTPEAEILLDSNGVILKSESLDGKYSNEIKLTNDNTNYSLFNFVDGDVSYIETTSSLNNTNANKVDLYYTKGVNGESSLQIEKDSSYYNISLNDTINNSTFSQTPSDINFTSKRSIIQVGEFTIFTPTSTIRDDDGTLLLENRNQVTISSNIIQLSKVDSTFLSLYIPHLPTYNNNGAALAGGLSVGYIYKKPNGELMIVH
jgi:hypothetical protein